MSDPYGPPFDPNRGYGQQHNPGNQGYGNQGYGNQGYGNQGYPEPSSGGGYSGGYPQPSSGGGYPGYSQPSSGGGGYPDYPQPSSGGGYQGSSQWGTQQPDLGYQQPQSGYSSPYQGYSDQYQAAPPPKKKSKAPMIIGIVVVVVLLLCGGGIAIALLANKSTTNSSSPGTGSSASSGTSTAPTTAAPATKISFAMPDKIGVLRKSTDQSRAAGLKSEMSTAGVEDPYAVMYEDSTSKGRVAVAWGGTGSAFGGSDPKSQIDAFFTSAGSSVGGGTVGARSDTSPGTVGGAAQCAKVDGTGVVMDICVWATDNALLGFIISGLTLDKAEDRMRSMLQAIVVKS